MRRTLGAGIWSGSRRHQSFPGPCAMVALDVLRIVKVPMDLVQLASRAVPNGRHDINQTIRHAGRQRFHFKCAGFNLPQPYHGEGVLIGISLDWGFDYTHPMFFDTTLTETRLRRASERFGTNTAKRKDPPRALRLRNGRGIRVDPQMKVHEFACMSVGRDTSKGQCLGCTGDRTVSCCTRHPTWARPSDSF